MTPFREVVYSVEMDQNGKLRSPPDIRFVRLAPRGKSMVKGVGSLVFEDFWTSQLVLAEPVELGAGETALLNRMLQDPDIRIPGASDSYSAYLQYGEPGPNSLGLQTFRFETVSGTGSESIQMESWEKIPKKPADLAAAKGKTSEKDKLLR